MNGDLQELMVHVSDLHNQQMQAIADLSSKFSEHKGDVNARVKVLEDHQKSTDSRQWIHSVVVLGLNTIHHVIATRLGWRF